MKFILVFAFLAGCALPPETLKSSGVEAHPPEGYAKLCAEQPALAVCPKAPR